MDIYHYSNQPFKKLLTLEKQGVSTETRGKNLPERYGKHISFFLEPIPYEFMGTIFGPGHSTWFPGNVVTEHTVDLDKVGRFDYELVESPEKVDLYYSDLVDKDYFLALDDIFRICHYRGNDAKTLEMVQRRLRGKVREYYFMLPSRPNFRDIQSKYAATVPHVMLYPATGEIPVVKTRKLTIGSQHVPKTAIKPYSEYKSSFESNGSFYDLNLIWKELAGTTVQFIEIDKLKWILNCVAELDKARVNEADPTVPGLVSLVDGKELIVDGLHRLVRAMKLNMHFLPYQRVSPELLKKAQIKQRIEQYFKPQTPGYKGWL